MPTNKNFGYSFVLIFFIISIIFIFFSKVKFGLVFIALSFISLLAARFKPNSLSFLNYIWYKFTILLQKIISPIIITILYFFIFCPYGTLAKLFSNSLKKLTSKDFRYLKTTWINVDNKINFKRQF